MDHSIDADLASPSFLTDPYPVYRRLRDEAPLYWADELGFWMLSRYDDVLAALRDGGRNFALSGAVAARFDELSPEDQIDLGPIRDHFSVGLLHSDPPEHTRLRRLVSQAFTPKTIEDLRLRVQTLVDQLLDDLAQKPDPDLVRDFTFPLPALVLCRVLGLSQDDMPRFKAWSDDIAIFIGSRSNDPAQAQRAKESLREVRAFFTEMADERRRRPTEDVVSRLANAAGDEALSPDELLSTCVTFLVGGHETTTALISSAALLLMQRPDQRAVVRDEPSVIGSLVEETIRYETPGQRATRRVVSDLEFGGIHLKRGQKVMLMLGAANRDAEHFVDAETFDVRRDPNRHLGFGMGHHFCIGAPLARLEGQVALASLTRRFPTMEPRDRVADWVGNFHHRQLRTLRVDLAPERVADA